MISSLLAVAALAIVNEPYGSLSKISLENTLKSALDVVEIFGDFLESRFGRRVISGVEYACPVYDIIRDETGFYIDFVGGEGYAIVCKGNVVTAYGFECDIPSIRQLKFDRLIADRNELFMLNGDQVEAIPITKSRNNDLDNFNSVYSGLGNSSTVEYGDLSNYLYTKYGVSFSLLSSGRLYGLGNSANNDGYISYPESCFVVNNVNGVPCSEGNCGLVSISNIVSYYSHFGHKTGFPAYSSLSYYYPYSDLSFLAQATSQTNECGNHYYPKSSAVELHSIYKKAREYAVSQGYLVGGMTDPQTQYAFENTCSFYGYTGLLTPYNGSQTTQSLIIGEINANRPFQFIVLGDAVYGGHGMMGTGFRVYQGALNYQHIHINVELFCVSVYDGWSSSERWIDADRLSMFPYDSSDYRGTEMKISTSSIL